MGQYYKPVSIEKMEHVYSHDYENGLKLMEHSYVGNNFVNVVEKLISPDGPWHGDQIVWAGDYADSEPETLSEDKKDGENLYNLAKNKIRPKRSSVKFRYIINLDTKEYVDKNKVPDGDDGWKIHPLPLLTCEGNGRGGGDYHGESELIGKWARNRVIADHVTPDGFTELIFDLVE